VRGRVVSPGAWFGAAVLLLMNFGYAADRLRIFEAGYPVF